MATNTLHLKISTPFQIVYEGEVQSVTSTNTEGKFDVLPEHANFITLIDNKPVTVRPKGEQPKEFNFPLAILYVHGNRVNIYTNIQEMPKLG